MEFFRGKLDSKGFFQRVIGFFQRIFSRGNCIFPKDFSRGGIGFFQRIFAGEELDFSKGFFQGEIGFFKGEIVDFPEGAFSFSFFVQSPPPSQV